MTHCRTVKSSQVAPGWFLDNDLYHYHWCSEWFRDPRWPQGDSTAIIATHDHCITGLIPLSTMLLPKRKKPKQQKVQRTYLSVSYIHASRIAQQKYTSACVSYHLVKRHTMAPALNSFSCLCFSAPVGVMLCRESWQATHAAEKT